MKTVYYCVDKQNREILGVGRMPDTWRNITGMSQLSGEAAFDLAWAGYPGFGFLTTKEVLEFGFTQEELNDKTRADNARESALVRVERDKMLAASDWTQLQDSPISVEKTLQWNAYRQALRELPNQPGFPWDIKYPIRP
jgi:hypothetical protein